MQQRSSNYEQFYLVEDAKVRESFRQAYDNMANLQAQIDKLVEILQDTNNADLAAIRTDIAGEFG